MQDASSSGSVQTPERLVSSGVPGQPQYFSVTNTCNGAETFELIPVTNVTEDFSSAGYTSQGPFVRFSLRLDQASLRDIAHREVPFALK